MDSSPSWTRRSAAGIAISLARTALTESIGLVALVVLSRLLGVADFGRYGIAISIVILIRIIALGGLSLAAVRRPRGLHPRTLSGLVAVEIIIAAPVAVGLVIVGLVLGGSWVGLLAGAAVVALMVPLQIPAFLDCYRRMRFGRLSLIIIAESLPLYAGVIAIALMGAGTGWLGSAFAVSAVGGALCARMIGGPPARPAALRAGWRALALARDDHAFIILFQSLLLLLVPVAGIVGGAAVAGELRWGLSVAAPIGLLSGLIIPVLYVPLARMGGDHLRANARVVSTSYVAVIAIAAAALGAMIGPLVPLVFGSAWIPATGVAQAAILILTLMAIADLMRSFLQGEGRTRPVMVVQAAMLVSSVIALTLGTAVASALVASLMVCGVIVCGIVAMAYLARDLIGARARAEAALIVLGAVIAFLAASQVPLDGISGILVCAATAGILTAAVCLAVVGRRGMSDVRAAALRALRA